MHQGKYSEAENLCRRALNTLESIFNRNHPNVAEVLKTMAELHEKAGNVTEVVKLEHRVEEIQAPDQIAYRSIVQAIERKNCVPHRTKLSPISRRKLLSAPFFRSMKHCFHNCYIQINSTR